MQWFEGNIPEAIAESQRRKVTFVAFVADQSEVSEKMNATLSDPKVGIACSPEACVAIKMNVNSEQCQQFSEFFPLVCVPVIYFIGNRGLPLEVVGGSVSADELVDKATAAFEAYKTSTENDSTQSSVQDSPVVTSASEEQPASQETATSCGSATNLGLNDRVQRAKQLMEETRKQKMEKEKEDETNKEIQRRKHGQELLKAKHELNERKAQMMQQKLKEDKAKERAHREEVRQQIARDKAERDAHRLRELQERQNATATQDASCSTSSSISQAPERFVDNKSTHARLQFRFPDGSSVTQTFPADSLLETPRQFIVSHSFASSYTSGFALFTTFPRRELTDDDLMKTLRDLDLTPSSTLIVMPKKQGRSMQGSGGSSVSDMILWVLSPLFALVNIIKMFLLGSSSQPRGAHGTTSRQSRQAKEDMSTNSSGVRRREGGIHRLRQTEDDDDDDNNTWNGNSTQQM